jgi:Glycosyl hydrolase family 20, domain 2/Carbohydrate family 9 binding domain-like
MQVKQILTVLLLTMASLLNANSFELIPTPKTVKYLGSDLNLKDYVIVTQAKLKQAQIAAEEINKRVEALGGRKLTVYPDSIAPAKLKNMKLIIIGRKHEHKYLKNIKLAIPNKLQGYAIKMTDDYVILAGNDRVGTLYAAVTFSQLLKKRNEIIIKRAAIKDWPDFKHRTVGDRSLSTVWRRNGIFDSGVVYGNNPPADAFYECLKEYIDWLLLQKLNLVIVSKKYLPGPLTTRIGKYANDRGIDIFMYHIFPFQSVGTVKANKGNNEYKNIRISKRHPGHYVSWSRDDLLTKEANRYAKIIQNGHYDYGYFESIDTGLTTLNYSEWDLRSKATKKRFSNDRAAADASVINLLYKIIRKSNPDFKFVFTIYPYSPDNVMKDNFPLNIGFDMPKRFAKHKRNQLKAYYRKLNRLIPDDICLLYREAMRKDVAAYRALFPKRAFDAYFDFGQDYKPIFATNPRFSKTFFFDNDQDIIYYATRPVFTQLSLNPIQTMLCAEYAWNVNGVDSDYFRYYIDPLKDSTAPKSIMEEFLPRACKLMWGENGAAMLPLMNSGLYMGYMQNPEKLLAKVKARMGKAKSAIEETGTISKVKLDMSPNDFINAAGIKKQYEAIKTARQSIEKILNKPDTKSSLLAQRYIIHYYKFASLWEVYSKVWFHYFKAHELYEAGDIAKGDREISAGIKTAKGMDAWIASSLRKIEGKPQFYKNNPAYPVENARFGLRNLLLSSKKFIAKFNKLKKTGKELGKSAVLNKSEQKQYTQRVLKSLAVKKKIKLDGKLTERSWQQAKAYTNFIKLEQASSQVKFAFTQTSVKFIHDKDNLYIGITCNIPNGNVVKAKKRQHDRGFWNEKDEDDCVEIFLDMNSDKKTYLHLATNLAGAKFDAKCTYKKKANVKWNGNWQVATSADKTAWIAEIGIPLNMVKDLAPRIGINIGRQNVSGVNREWSSISILKNRFHDVKNYSTLEISR